MPPPHSSPRELGEALAQLLRRAWDPNHVSAPPTEAKEHLTALLLRSGGAGLAYYPMRGTDPASSPLAARLRQQHRQELMRARLRERSLAETVATLRNANVEPLLIKGWAIARLYPDPGMRPYGDLDLCVRNDDYEPAMVALRNRVIVPAPVELHLGSALQGDLQYETLFDRSKLVSLNGVEIRVPAEEQHLRLLALHMLGHGVSRPNWLCDLAVAVESRGPDFDWDLCLHGDPRLSRWLLVTLLLARELLGARLCGTPAASPEVHLPRWVIPEVLDTWGRGRSAHMDASPGAYLIGGGVSAFVQAVRANWRNGLQASFELRAPANNFPRFPYRFAATVARLPNAVQTVLAHRAAAFARSENPPLPNNS